MDEKQTLRQTREAIQQGNRTRAQRLLYQVIQANSRSETAWLWLSAIVGDPNRERECLERVLEIDPSNNVAREHLQKLCGSESSSPDIPSSGHPADEEGEVREAKATETREATKRCPYCAEEIQDAAIVCRYCGRDLRYGGNGSTQASASKMPTSSGAKALAGISIACGVIGFVVFGIPLGIAALACGIPALAMGANGGRVGIILGILDILAALVIMGAFSGTLC